MMMETLPHLIIDFLERSSGSPLSLQVSYRGPPHPLPKGSLSIINALDQHSGRWHDVSFTLPPVYLRRLRPTSPPQNLQNISIWDPKEYDDDATTATFGPLVFSMDARPGPMKFTVIFIPLKAVDISWDRLVHLNVTSTSFDSLPEIIRDSPLLETCSLFNITLPVNVSETIIRHPRLRTFKLVYISDEAFTKILNSLEFPSLELWRLELVENGFGLDAAVSFLKRSGSGLKTLDLVNIPASASEDVVPLLQATPHLQCLRVEKSFSSVTDNILKGMSAAASHPMSQTSNMTGFLSELQSLEVFGDDLDAWACIPLIYRSPHRKLLSLDINMYRGRIRDELLLRELGELVDQGIKLHMSSRRKLSPTI